jgi:hypothetical protein
MNPSAIAQRFLPRRLQDHKLPSRDAEQMVFLGNPEYGCDLNPIDFAGFARACGGAGFTIEEPEDCGTILDQALATPGPALIEALVDPFEPSHAGQGHCEAGGPLRRIPGPRDSQPKRDPPDDPFRQGPGAGISRPRVRRREGVLDAE